MSTFLVEVYAPGVEQQAFVDLVERMRSAVTSLADEGIGVRYVRGILVPAEETCFHLLVASSADAVAEAGRRADLDYERVVAVIESGEEDGFGAP